MVDKLTKFIKKQDKKTAKKVRELLDKIYTRDLKGLNIKKLQGKTTLYRIRKGSLRIILEEIDGKLKVLSVNYRNDQTYRDV